jgi:hypothetical protein
MYEQLRVQGKRKTTMHQKGKGVFHTLKGKLPD